MSNRNRWLASLLVQTCLSTFVVAEPGSIVWLLLDVPPSVILEGPHQGQGNLDQIRRVFVSQLPEYTHLFEVSNIERVTRELQGVRQVISPGLLLTPERSQLFTLSLPEAITPANMLIVRKARVQEFQRFRDLSGEVDLEQLLMAPISVGVALGRRYSGTIDALLVRHKDNPNLLVRSSSDVSEGLVKMLLTNRLDASLLFPFEARFVADQLGSASDLVSLPIRGMPAFSVTVAAAPKTAWGEAIIARLNAIIRANRQTVFLDALSPWLDEEANKLYRARALEYFAAHP